MLVPPPELEANASLWLWAVSQYKARVTFCSYSVMETCARGLGAQTAVLRVRAGRAWRDPRTSPSDRKTLPGRPAPCCELPPTLRHTPVVHLLGGEWGGRRAGWVRPWVGAHRRVSEASGAGARGPSGGDGTEEAGLEQLGLYAQTRPCAPTPPTDEGREPVVRAHLHGGGRGAAQDRAHTVLLQAVQGPGPARTRREHHIRLQGQCGHLPAGRRQGFPLGVTCTRRASPPSLGPFLSPQPLMLRFPNSTLALRAEHFTLKEILFFMNKDLFGKIKIVWNGDYRLEEFLSWMWCAVNILKREEANWF